MTTRLRRRIVALVVCASAISIGLGAAASAQDDDAVPEVQDVSGRTVVVATKALDPFVIIDSTDADGSGLRGYSIDVWNELADRLGLTTEWVVEETVGDILDSARVGDADVAIAGISMTAERETVIDFAHPYYDSGLQVVTRPSGDAGTWESLWGVITSGTVLALAGGLIVLIGVVADLVWRTSTPFTWPSRRPASMMVPGSSFSTAVNTPAQGDTTRRSVAKRVSPSRAVPAPPLLGWPETASNRASMSAGVLTLRFDAPLAVRLTVPVRTVPGPSSTKVVKPWLSSSFSVWRQRTGLVSWDDSSAGQSAAEPCPMASTLA